jgi:cytochrome c peroxidase
MILPKRGPWLPKPVVLGLIVAAGLTAADFDWNLPKGFPRPVVPSANPMSTAKIELGLNGHEAGFLAVLRGDSLYQGLFPRAFPGESKLYTLANVTKAIAAFERTIVSVHSPYDRYRWGGDPTAISDAAKRGELIFSSSERGGCFQCHGGWTLSGSIRFEASQASQRDEDPLGGFFNTGVTSYDAPNRGLFEQTHKAEDIGKFRAPTLRNIAVTAPYMHDGSLRTLEEVIDHYAAGRMDHPNKTHPSSIPDDRRRKA